MPPETLLDAALGYAARGWSVIPIRHKPGTNGKQPAAPWKAYQTRPPTESELRSWFGDGQAVDGLAVILGDASGGLVCRDFDTPESYEQWAAGHPDLAESLPTVETARGRHVYFRSAWRGFVDLGDGELRGTRGHYTVLPPSIHPKGTRYRWIVPWPDGDLAPVDPCEVGLMPETERAERTERAEHTERAETTEDTEDTESQSNQVGPDTCSHGSVLSVSRSIEPALADAIEAAIREAQPSTVGQRNRAVFELARTLKAIPALADAAVGDLRDILWRWHERALPIIGTKPFDETWADFVAAWPRVRFPKGQEPMTQIVERANASPLPSAAERYDAAETRRLVAICRELQRACGDAPFFLSCRTAGRLVGLDHATAWRRLGMLVADGVLIMAQTGTTRRATRYRYASELCAETERA